MGRAASGAAQPSGTFFENAGFIGGVDPEDGWTQGWTTADPN